MITHTNKARTLGEFIPGCDELMNVIWCGGDISDFENNDHSVCYWRWGMFFRTLKKTFFPALQK
jgi:hypothetical protein